MTALKVLLSLSTKYLVTIPAQLAFPSTQKVCLDLSPGSCDVKFTITLETKDKTQKLLEHSGSKKNFYCISFSVSADQAFKLIPRFPGLLPGCSP